MRSALAGREYILARVKEDANGCWIWQRCFYMYGYGHSVFENRHEGAHRTSYKAFVGPIPEGLVLDHLCRVPSCCNPAHLEPVTQRENLMRGDTLTAENARKTHCPQGHAYAGDNLQLSKEGRVCGTCNRDASRRSRARRSA